MEEKESSASGVAVSSEEGPDSYRVAPRNENSSGQFSGPTMAAPASTASPSPVSAAAPPPSAGVTKKKRGRPRKYGPDGTVALAISPMPISSSIPLTGEFSAWKRGRGKPVDPIKKSQNKYEAYEPPDESDIFGVKVESGSAKWGDTDWDYYGEKIAYSVGANFTPHVLTVNAGEDVTMKVMSFSQQGARAICILSANGTISNVTLRQPTSSGGTLTYEGRFEILSLSGSYMPTENAGTKSRSGGMSVSLAGPDGRVVGGGLAGLLIAAGPVQVVVGSFLPGHQQEQKPKKQRIEPIAAITPPIINTVTGEETRAFYGGVKPIVTSAAYNIDNSSSLNSIHGYRNLAPEIKSPLPEEESKSLSQSNCEVSC
ncbi:PPC domain containing protein [Parasponia andersonii]|uniref:AT-hook motif nuclear-localized protein n=1 Tax=Parasponia andersonii TaxID=3476 RepID=A0A2P5D9Q2_PARAD|nr:PPC domain containing protein [Parasponia andersonii]